MVDAELFTPMKEQQPGGLFGSKLATARQKQQYSRAISPTQATNVVSVNCSSFMESMTEADVRLALLLLRILRLSYVFL